MSFILTVLNLLIDRISGKLYYFLAIMILFLLMYSHAANLPGIILVLALLRILVLLRKLIISENINNSGIINEARNIYSIKLILNNQSYKKEPNNIYIKHNSNNSEIINIAVVDNEKKEIDVKINEIQQQKLKKIIKNYREENSKNIEKEIYNLLPVNYFYEKYSFLEFVVEVVALLTFLILIPFNLWLYTRDFVYWSFYFKIYLGSEFYESATLMLLVLLYFIPVKFSHYKFIKKYKYYWWLSPLVPSLFLLSYSISTKHQYLNPFNPDRINLAVERVTKLGIVQAGAHSKLIFDYAKNLENSNIDQSIKLYEYGLQIDPTNKKASEQYSKLLEYKLGSNSGFPIEKAILKDRRVLKDKQKLCNFSLNKKHDFKNPVIAIITMGEVDDLVVKEIITTIESNLKLSACKIRNEIDIPESSKFKGLKFGNQWNVNSIIDSFAEKFNPYIPNNIRYLIVTNKNIYSGKSNYVFSSSYPWGVVASYAMLGDISKNRELVVKRMGKLILGSTIKSFGIPPSTNPKCITSYTKNLYEFDNKGSIICNNTIKKIEEILEK